MAKRKSGYYGLSWLMRVIISFIPFVSTVVHLLARLSASKSTLFSVLLIIFHLIFGWNVFWLIDIITTLVIRRIILT